ncbi:ParB/RepB/Spo0J family partition protein [Mesosutterella sp. OilRF-GAM-744-9]|uniref:ParB/RepB/Spo0J family partition protein n=1 Tax=Mesosutterella porci TaxID=2915351 RepID=A0ABS9MQ46_9BURK|nr:ParB/RepB/Spo0J family partition protein [Mesosutterella sp. oilRF-744-WT-GAM-9]MCG5030158.1 ParB/RepB/Spo0J family partition protein [Mesosutterella sp. oilRF-744-WT-GAM-9]MCI6530544.1 ParB/RepB/Spo0J family partition protein [Mesosutterella sp.]
MALKRKALGRGLGALGLGSAKEIFDNEVPEKDKGANPVPKEGGLAELPIDCLQPGKYQPRTHMDPESIASLSASIKSQGLMSPLLVRSVGPQRWEIIAGERRYRAAKMAGMKTIPVIIRDVPDKQALSLSLIENIQREGLNPIEEAQGMIRLMKEFNMTQDQMSEALGKSRPAISNTLRLLKLTPQVQNLLMADKIDMGHARALIPLKPDDQIFVANQIVMKGLSVRETERTVSALLSEGRKKTVKKTAKKTRDILHIEESLSDTFGAEVKLSAETREKGKITIKYTSLDQLNELLERLGYTS